MHMHAQARARADMHAASAAQSLGRPGALALARTHLPLPAPPSHVHTQRPGTHAYTQAYSRRYTQEEQRLLDKWQGTVADPRIYAELAGVPPTP